MVSFILGNSIKKRAYYCAKNNGEEVYIDDMRLCADTVKNGVYYYAMGKRPFMNMQVGDFVAYSRILFDGEIKDKRKVKALLKGLCYKKSIAKKLGKLTKEDYVKVLLASKIKDTTQKIYINLDSWIFNKGNVKRVKKLATAFAKYSVYFLVSDFRFSVLGGVSLYHNIDGNSFNLDNEKTRKKVAKNRVLSMIKSGKAS